jgi:hypothetical protein
MFRSNFFTFLSTLILVSCLSDPSPYSKNYIKNDKEYQYLESEFNDGQTPKVDLFPKSIIPSIQSKNGEELFFSKVFCLNTTLEGYLISDDGGARLIHCDNQFKLKDIIGRRGDGPGEFRQPRYSMIEKDNIFSSGTANKGFAVHDFKGKLLHNFKSKSSTFDPIISKFCVVNGKVYHSTPNSEVLIKAMDQNGAITESFGSPLHYDAPHSYSSRGHILNTSKGEIIFVGEAIPVIQRYSTQGKLLSSHNLIKHPYFKSFFEGVKERIRKSARNDMSYLLVQDAQYVAGKLYLLLYSYNQNYEVSLNKLLVVAGIESGKLVLEQEISLKVPKEHSPNVWFESFCVNPQQEEILAFESISSSFISYSLN